jgi:hypothetical protein
MILGEIRTYQPYRHIETGRLVEAHTTTLQVKTDRHWQTSVLYSLINEKNDFGLAPQFAVPVDHFRLRFEEVKGEGV